MVAMARMEARRRIDEAKRDTAAVLAKKRANHSTVLPTGLDHSNRPRTCKNSQPERKGKKGGRKRENGSDATRTEKNRLVTDERTSRAHKRCLEGSRSSSSREKSRDRFSGIRVDVRNWRIATKSNEKQKLVSQFKKLPQRLGWQMSWKKWIND